MEENLDVAMFWLICGFIIFLLVLFVVQLRGAKASREWMQTKGIILESRIRQSRKGGYRLDVRYRYTVQGEVYVGRNRGYGVVDVNFIGRKFVNKYREGQGVTVYYCPEKPKRAVLEPGVHWGIFMPLVLSVVFSVALVLSLTYGLSIFQLTL